jgi:hypothetical protein
MDDQHLVNTMSMLMRNAASDLELNRRFYNSYPPPHAEQAEVLFEQEWDYWMEATIMDCVNPIFWQMRDDAERRGLHLEEKWENAHAQPRVVFATMPKAQ